MELQLYWFYFKGGPFMHVISLWGIIALCIIGFRAYFFLISKKNRPEIMRRKIAPLAKIVKSSHKRIGELTFNKFNSTIGDNVTNEINYHRQRIEAMIIRIDVVITDYKSRASMGLEWLFQLANLATLTGLLGTVFGLITAFSSLSEVIPAEKNNIMATGISNAMNTTAYGLIIALPCLFFYQLFTGIIENRISILDRETNLTTKEITDAPEHRDNGA